MTSTWLDACQADVARVAARLSSVAEGLRRERHEIVQRLDQLVEQRGQRLIAREQAGGQELHARVMAAFEAGSFVNLTLREQRYAARRFANVGPSQMQRLLAQRPGNWATFAKECYRRWDELEHVADRPGYARLLCLAPLGVSFLHHGGRPQDLVGVDAPRRVAQQLHGENLIQAKDALRRRGFDPAWSFSALTLAHWAANAGRARATFASLWEAASADLQVESMLLPRRRAADGASRSSWFSALARPATFRATTQAQAIFVGALLEAWAKAKPAERTWGVFADELLKSEFGDPRVPPESAGWIELKKVARAPYERFLEELISEDLSIFFAHAMNDPRRKRFWLKYLRSIRRTACILDRTTAERLHVLLAGADKQLASAMARTHRFLGKKRAEGVSAFCLYFDQFVVVEFSEYGNAAYVYERAVFERMCSSLKTIPDAAALKSPSASRERIVHSSSRWEELAEARLSSLGIRTSRDERQHSEYIAY